MARRTLNPGVPLSIRKAEMPPRARFSLSVTAIRMVKSASLARLIQILRPLMIQSSPSRTAVVIMPAGSPPAPGSEIPIAETVSPRT